MCGLIELYAMPRSRVEVSGVSDVGSAGSGQSNVVAQAGYDNVCDIGPSVPSKTQCVRWPSSVPYRGPLSHVVTSVPPNRQCAGSAGSGQSNVVAQAGYNNVCDIGPSVPSKTQCVRWPSSVPYRRPRSHVVTSVPPNRQCAG
nr:hypothetical protein [Tanacetum cinerariifolium]